jgi:hypothetical protein
VICPGSQTQSGNDEEHPPEPVFRVYLQLNRSANRSRSALSILWHPAEPDSGGRGDEFQFGLSHNEFVAIAERKTMILRRTR